MSISNRHDSSHELERRLDRDFDREPTYGIDRKRIPLDDGGAIKTYYGKHHPVTPSTLPAVKPEPQWSPTADREVA